MEKPFPTWPTWPTPRASSGAGSHSASPQTTLGGAGGKQPPSSSHQTRLPLPVPRAQGSKAVPALAHFCVFRAQHSATSTQGATGVQVVILGVEETLPALWPWGQCSSQGGRPPSGQEAEHRLQAGLWGGQ